MIEEILQGIFNSIAVFLENGLLGVFGLVEIVKSDNVNNKYALIFVSLYTLAISTLYFSTKDKIHNLYNKKLKPTKRKQKPQKGSNTNSKSKIQKKSTSKRSNTSKKGSKNNKTEIKTTRSGATRINTKKELVTPGTKRK